MIFFMIGSWGEGQYAQLSVPAISRCTNQKCRHVRYGQNIIVYISGKTKASFTIILHMITITFIGKTRLYHGGFVFSH